MIYSPDNVKNVVNYKGRESMALKIRFARGGSKKRPYYRMVVADVRAPRDGRFIEKVGAYNPCDNAQVIVNEERVKYWLSQGAMPTDRVAKLLGKAQVIPMPEIRETPKKSAPKAKALERLKAKQEAEEAAKAAAEEAHKTVEEAPAAEEAPVEEEAPEAQS